MSLSDLEGRDAQHILLVLGLLCLPGFVSTQGNEPPYIRTPLSQERLTASVGAHYQLQCDATGVPSPAFKWFKDDVDVSTYRPHIQVLDNGTLYITSFRNTDVGLYQCVAENEFGRALSVKVPVLAVVVPTFSLPDDIAKGTEGEAFSLKYKQIPKSVPDRYYQWYQASDSLQIQSDQRRWIDSEGTLWFAYLKSEDAIQYKFGMAPKSEISGNTIALSNTVTLQVVPSTKTDVVYKPPQFQFKSPDMKAYINDTATLECFFSGMQLSNVTWKDSNNRPISPDDRRFKMTYPYGYQLTILNVKDEDEGIFTCTASNGFGNPSAQIKVNVTSPPLKVPNEGLTSATIPDGRNVTLGCAARAAQGENLDTPVWYRNGVNLRQDTFPDSQRYSFSPDYKKLYIRKLSKTVDTAAFQCNVTNSEGYAFYGAFLRVIESIKVINKPNEVNKISGNDVINIGVKVTGDSCCPIRTEYYLKGAPLSEETLSKPPFVYVNKENIKFNASSVSTATLSSWLGEYSIRASSQYDSVNVTFSIVSEAGPTAQPYVAAGAGLQLWAILLICGIALIIIAVIIAVIVLKRNYPKAVYQLEKTELRHNLNPKQDLLDQSFQDI